MSGEDLTRAQQLAEDALRRLNRELGAISSCVRTLLRADSEPKLLDDICRIVCEEAGYRMAWVGYREDGGERQSALRYLRASSGSQSSSTRWAGRWRTPARPPSA